MCASKEMFQKTIPALVFLLCLVFLPSTVVTVAHEECISTISQLEKSLLSRESNIDNLTEAFFPPSTAR